MLCMLDLEEWDLWTFFELCSNASEEQPSLGIDHFVRGCIRMKGPAKNVDLMALKHDIDMLSRKNATTKKELQEAVAAALGSWRPGVAAGITLSAPPMGSGRPFFQGPRSVAM